MDIYKYGDDLFFYAPWVDDYYIILTLVRKDKYVSRVINKRVFEENMDIACKKIVRKLDAYEQGKATVTETFAH